MPSMFDTFVFRGSEPGPRVLVLGAVHGNEQCGSIAIERVRKQLSSRELRIRRGQLTLVPATNRLAFERNQRAGDRNLNRNLQPSPAPRDNEDRVANELCPLLAENDVLLDLHSFHSPGTPFVMVGPEDNTGLLEPFSHAAQEEAMARSLGVSRAVDGWLDTYARGASRRGGSSVYGIGTTEYMRAHGGFGVTLECGQHQDPGAPGVAHTAILNCLAHLRLIDAPEPQARAMETLRLVEVVDREQPEDRFVKGWASFEPVAAGERVGWRGDGTEVRAQTDGFIAFPNVNAAPGAEWFYFATRAGRFA